MFLNCSCISGNISFMLSMGFGVLIPATTSSPGRFAKTPQTTLFAGGRVLVKATPVPEYPHIAEHHRLNVNRRSEMMGYTV